ncbi:hypothetical protein NX059_002333 [Plenodomus lindquistii]|nr:hypothetical protein NX059_002333 [Plenodomus lindquistii]
MPPRAGGEAVLNGWLDNERPLKVPHYDPPGDTTQALLDPQPGAIDVCVQYRDQIKVTYLHTYGRARASTRRRAEADGQLCAAITEPRLSNNGW